jgi:trk system potassium uptake protein TrkA
MYLIVVGAGPIGLALARAAIGDGHNVALIEKDETRAERAIQSLDARVFQIDIGEADVGAETDLADASVVAAVTNDDSRNLMAMVLAREAGVEARISIVNEPGHRRLFERLGVQVLEDPEEILARHLYGLIQHPQMNEFFPLPGGKLAFEITIGTTARVAGKTVSELRSEEILPDGMFVLTIHRPDDDGELRAVEVTLDTQVESRDRVLVLAIQGVHDEQLEVFTGS